MLEEYVTYGKAETPHKFFESFLICREALAQIVKETCDEPDLKNVESFARYIVLRQQRIYRLYGKIRGPQADPPEFSNIYKGRVKKIYEHSHFDRYMNPDSIQ